MRGEAKTDMGRAFADHFVYPPNKTFSIDYYKRECALRLAREFCRVANWFIGVWEEAHFDTGFRFTQDDLDALPPDAEFQMFVCCLEDGDPVVTTSEEFERIRPMVD